MIAERAKVHGTDFALCGEMAGRPLEAMALIGLGFRQISMAPASIGPVKAMILSLNAEKLRETLFELIDRNSLKIYGRNSQISLRKKTLTFSAALGRHAFHEARRSRN